MGELLPVSLHIVIARTSLAMTWGEGEVDGMMRAYAPLEGTKVIN